jgi:hypothetical protein
MDPPHRMTPVNPLRGTNARATGKANSPQMIGA